MADSKVAHSAGAEDAEVFLSASEDEAVPQVITPELLSALVKQVEFYFSDANLPTDKKLLKQIRKDPEGYVPVKLFANFRKVRALSKDVGIITEALRSASLLQLSQDSKRVRRIVPVPEYDISDIQRRTIVVENLPGNPSPTIESVTEMFRVYGRVKLVRICSRESKGKLPSWLTSSCQHMGGTQHAYVEFEEEEGAILAAAALAQDSDAPDGVVQVRRLLACIAEQRERRSVTGTGGSSFGGSSGGGSRKGSRDVSPLGSRNAGSRRGSGGGGWICSSNGGAALDAYHPAFHSYRTYGGAFDGSRSSSGGGAGPSPSVSFVPPPPPPPRRSCDSAPVSDLLPVATTTVAPLPAPTPPSSARSINAYRPPAKRLSDGFQTGFQSLPVGGVTSGVIGILPQPLQRCAGGSFGSSCGTALTSAGGTPTAAPSSPSPMSTTFINLVAHSPPLVTRGASSGGGRPPVHPPIVPPPPPPPPKPQSSLSESQPVAIATAPSPTAHHPTQTPTPASSAPSALAEAIAQLQAERRASEAGGTKATVSDVGPTPAPAPAPTALAAPMAAPRTVPTAPKFCLDLAAGAHTRGSRSITSQESIPNAGVDVASKTAPTVIPRGSQTQMVANVEDFINNILAGRSGSRSTPAPMPSNAAPPSSAGSGTQARKPVVPAVPRTMAVPQQQPAVDAALAVAGILASTLRRPVPVSSYTTPAVSNAPLVKPPAAVVEQVHVVESATIAPAAEAPVPVPVPAVFITAVGPGMDFSLEHAVTVTVHRSPAPGTAGLSTDCCSKKSPIPATDASPTPVVTYASSGGINSATSSPPSSPIVPLAKGIAKANGSKTSSACPNSVGSGQTTTGSVVTGRAQPGAKRFSRRDYAQWAAATPEFRAEAASKFAGSSASGSPNSTAGGFGRSSGGGAGPAGGCGPASPPSVASVSISDGGVFGTVISSGQNSGGGNLHFHSNTAAPIWHVAKGPDGSKGFGGRTRVPVT
ncbi:hypothetical protein Vafri_18272 [Volvox africanus]|uniref:HTH La-type RNA-binding domain-containing protein n=1 Tax=Volvox africanus TaxID=51714 RepID=A0A8J4BM70_9CHLO|nr:hypothetical protein Vafri_18272 [Volvox africanus]